MGGVFGDHVRSSSHCPFNERAVGIISVVGCKDPGDLVDGRQWFEKMLVQDAGLGSDMSRSWLRVALIMFMLKFPESRHCFMTEVMKHSGVDSSVVKEALLYTRAEYLKLPAERRSYLWANYPTVLSRALGTVLFGVTIMSMDESVCVGLHVVNFWPGSGSLAVLAGVEADIGLTGFYRAATSGGLCARWTDHACLYRHTPRAVFGWQARCIYQRRVGSAFWLCCRA